MLRIKTSGTSTKVRTAVEDAGGRLLNVAGDGTFSTFDGPVAAVEAARVVLDMTSELGLAVRAGVHGGEVQSTGPDMSGMTVHVGARIGAMAGPGEILVSQTVRDLVVGSGFSFAPHGKHSLKGVPGTWTLFSPGGTDRTRYTSPRARPALGVIDQAVLSTARRAPQILRRAVEFTSRQHRRPPN